MQADASIREPFWSGQQGIKGEMTSTELDVLGKVDELTRLALRTYQVNPARIEEDANGERRIHQGGYGDRQIFELVQNAADELRATEFTGGRIEVVLTTDYLYCANEGSPITATGVDTILRMGVSKKRGGQIGRFGVGVKSVLSVSRMPQFFSRTGSFGFDADWAAEEILKAVNEARRAEGKSLIDTLGETPVLRLARRLDPNEECRRDRALEDLLSWATTVVRLPLEPGAANKLARDIHTSKSAEFGASREFPHLFQLFSPHVGKLALEDRTNMPFTRREISVDHSGTRRSIHQQRSRAHATSESFRVFTTPHRVSDEARGRAGELHDRVTIDVSWAVPEYTRSADSGFHLVPNDRGVFWSFFPTKYPTTLSGALNAAWKTNEDRQNLLDSSDLNTELMRVAARLVVGSLEELSPADDPGAYLPLLPGRPKESPNWACRYLTEQVWRLMATNPSLPDQRGRLCLPSELRIHPDDPVTTKALELWASYPGRPQNWIHHSVEGPNSRRGKVSHVIAESKHTGPASPRSWVEALVEDGTVEASAAAIRLLAHLLRTEFTGPRHAEAADELRRSRVLMTEDGRFVAPIVGTVFRRTSDDGLRDDIVYVHQTLANDQPTASLLNELGVREADLEGRFHSVLDQGFSGYTDVDWMRFWELLNGSGGAVQAHEIRKRVDDVGVVLHARNMEGRFSPIRGLLLPGRIVPGDGSRDAALTVDMSFHANDQSILREFGVTDRPGSGYNPEDDGWFEGYRDAMYAQYCAGLPPTATKVQTRTLQFHGGPTAGPLHLFKRLSPEGRAEFLASIPESAMTETWTRQIGKQTNSRAQVMSPIRWLLTEEGFVHTSLGLTTVRNALGPGLREYAAVLPVAEIGEAKALKLRMPNKVEDVPPARWAKLLDAVRTSEDEAFVGRNYALLMRVAYDLVSEEADVRCRVVGGWANLVDSEIAVATTRAEYRDLIEEGHPALLVDRPEDAEQAESMIAVWGMRRVSDVIERRIRFVPSGAPVALVDEYPMLRMKSGARVKGIHLQWCEELEQVIRTPKGARYLALKSAREDSAVLILQGTGALQTLVLADTELELGLGLDGCRQVIDEQKKREANEATRRKVQAIKEAPMMVAKLALMLTREQLLANLPAGLVEGGEEHDVDRLAQLALNAHDDLVLKVYAKEIARNVPDCPSSFNGGERARQFVAGLGISGDFAGSQAPKLDPRETVQGPKDFPALHPYQEKVADRLVQMLCSSTPRRGMLSLPTGAGKTRVAAEGVIRWVRESGVPRGPILWIAQTEELCEQAVQSWQFVWEKVGPGRPLVIDRFWSSNSSTAVRDQAHLVVATDAKLALNLSDDEYSWLRDAALVIVDEAHGAGSPRYTDILRLMGLTHALTSRHLLGLSATPFRNDAERTRLLAQRFGDYRLDKGVFGDRNPIEALQMLRILAKVEHRVLEGADIELDANELREVNQVGNFAAAGVLPKSAERKLADHEGRNDELVRAITDLPSDWPVLVFATSVDHAKVLAARLQDKGVRSVSIDAMTAPADRRKRVDEFRKGNIRVITNYGVLSQGFDAPATRAVVIARPVYSANLYQQMIGRGLRGVANGGEAECMILDVRDNITNFDAKLAFTEFEYLWKEIR
ncbi:DEAD/DEAH box helicase [Nocardia sp. NPDC058640]|uniref:DEAD/DEAH box helicase n=1 Tax=Nocardia sp. NPDC058640 TaxID=3346571 RepID=UPI00364F82BA